MTNNKIIKSEYDWVFSQDTLIDIISRIIKRGDEVKKEASTEFNDGRKLAYYEVVDIIKNELEGRGFDFNDFY